MKYQTFTFSEDEASYLLEIAISALMDNAQLLRQADKKRQPDSYAQMFKLVMTGSMVAATLNGLTRTDLGAHPSPESDLSVCGRFMAWENIPDLCAKCGNHKRLHTINESPPQARARSRVGETGAIALMDDATLHEIASNPHCVHGLPFSQPCQHCTPPAEAPAESSAAPVARINVEGPPRSSVDLYARQRGEAVDDDADDDS